MKRYFALLLALVMLAGCAKAPDSSSENAAKTEKVSELPELTESTVKEIEAQDYDNFTFAEDFELSYDTTAKIYQMKLCDPFADNYKALFSHYAEDFTPEKVEAHEEALIYEDDKMFVLKTDNGGFTVSDKDCLNKVIYGNTVEYISTDILNNKSEKRLTVGSKEVKVSELENSCSEFLTDLYSSANYPNTIEPYSVSVQTVDGTNAATVHCRTVFEGLPVFDTMSTNTDYSFDIAELPPCVFTFIDGSEIGQFAVGQTYEKVDEEPAEIITPLSAMNAASEKLSGFAQWEVQSEELVLMPEFTDNTQTTLRLTPYWVIWFDRSWWHETFAAVNAVTGEVDFVDNSR